MPNVKTSKPTRAARALETRMRMLAAAHGEFSSQGYAATTMGEIADRAGVAVQTLYYTFRTKGLLLREVMESAAGSGADPGPVSDRRWLAEIMSSPNPQRILALSAEHASEVYARAAPLWPAIRAAALTDPEVDRYWREVAESRRLGMGQVIEKIAASGALRSGLSPKTATDLMYTLAGHATFQDLVVDAHWPAADYKAWLFTTLVQQLLGLVDIDRDALVGLSFGNLASRPEA